MRYSKMTKKVNVGTLLSVMIIGTLISIEADETVLWRGYRYEAPSWVHSLTVANVWVCEADNSIVIEVK
jgi:hypothetical protein